MSRWPWHKILFFLVVSAVLIMIAGCAHYWYQPGKTFQQISQDKSQCLEELNKRSDNPTLEYRQKFMKNCMKEKGYQAVGENDLPLDAKREGTEDFWATPGIAGKIDSNQ